MRNLLHAVHLLATRSTGAQVCLDGSLNRRLQQAGQILLEAVHHYRVHMFLPLPVKPYRCKLPRPNVFVADLRPLTGYHTSKLVRAQPATRPGARSRRCAALTSFCRARNSFTLMVFSFMPVLSANSSTEYPSTSFIINNMRSSSETRV